MSRATLAKENDENCLFNINRHLPNVTPTNTLLECLIEMNLAFVAFNCRVENADRFFTGTSYDISVINNRNRSTPATEPRGTPQSDGTVEEQ